MKKTMKILMCCLLAIGMMACGKREPNARRKTDYKFDFVDYIDIITYGESGDGYLEIKTKDLSVKDFESEQDYINVKNDLDSLNLNYLQGKQQNTSLTISQSTELKNGDIIQIGIKTRKELNSDLNIETYEYVVENLRESTEVDLFSPQFVTFYARDDGKLGFHIKDDFDLPEDLIKYLKYNITTEDELQVDKTILHITADMDGEFLKNNDYYTITVFLAKHGLKGAIEADKVLQHIVKPIDIGSANSYMIEQSLYSELYKSETSLAKVCNLQQLERQKVSEPYNYIVTYYNDNLGQREYWRRMVTLVYIDEKYVVVNVGSRESTTEEYRNKAYDSSELLLNFMMGDETSTEEVQEEVPEETSPEENAENNTEVNEQPEG